MYIYNQSRLINLYVIFNARAGVLDQIYITRGEVERCISDKARIASVLNDF